MTCCTVQPQLSHHTSFMQNIEYTFRWYLQDVSYFLQVHFRLPRTAFMIFLMLSPLGDHRVSRFVFRVRLIDVRTALFKTKKTPARKVVTTIKKFVFHLWCWSDQCKIAKQHALDEYGTRSSLLPLQWS